MKRAGLLRLRSLEPVTPVVRYEGAPALRKLSAA